MQVRRLGGWPGVLVAVLLVGCAPANSVRYAEDQELLHSLADRVAQLEAQQKAFGQQVAAGMRVPRGIVAVPANRRSGVYDDQPIRDAMDNPEEDYEQALALYRAGDIDHAITAFQQYLQHDTTGSREHRSLARYWLGDAYYNQRHYEEANRYLAEYLRVAPDGEKAEAALDKLVSSLRAVGRDEDADSLLVQ